MNAGTIIADQMKSSSGDGSSSILGFSFVALSGVAVAAKSLQDGAYTFTHANIFLSVSVGVGKLIVIV